MPVITKMVCKKRQYRIFRNGSSPNRHNNLREVNDNKAEYITNNVTVQYIKQ